MQEKFTYTIPQTEYSIDQIVEATPQNPEIINVPNARIDSREVGIARVAVYNSLPEIAVQLTAEQIMHARIAKHGEDINGARSYELDSRLGFYPDDYRRAA
ncbi:MAG: hypothetical protein ABI716_02185 [Candidatus Saccharibacteria bacterium]